MEIKCYFGTTAHPLFAGWKHNSQYDDHYKEMRSKYFDLKKPLQLRVTKILLPLIFKSLVFIGDTLGTSR